MIPEKRCMPAYRFTESISVDGKPYKNGDVIAEDDIESGCVKSCLRLGRLVPLSEEEKEAILAQREAEQKAVEEAQQREKERAEAEAKKAKGKTQK